MEKFWMDLKYASRILTKKPGFTVVAILTLALGIGANTAIFSVVNAVLLRNLPYHDSNRLVMVWESNPRKSREKNTISPANFLDWRDRNDVFSQMSMLYDTRFNLTGSGEPEELVAQVVSPEFFDLLGSAPLIGRTFAPEHGERGHDDVAVLSYGLWQRRFGSEAGVLNKTITLNGSSVEVIGVMPAGFQFFIKNGSLVGKPADLWMPLTFGPNSRVRQGRYATSIARLKPGVTVEQAQLEMISIASGLAKEFPAFDANWSVRVEPLDRELTGEIRPALLVLLGAVALVLLIACANVANLMLARGATRKREVAIRSALGAQRGTVIRQLLTESCLISILGGAAGTLLAIWGLDSMLALMPKNLINPDTVTLNYRVLAFTGLLSLLTGVAFGLVPAIETSKPDLNETLKESGKTGAAGAHGHRLRNIFVVAQIALSLVLLISAGLMIRSFSRLESVDPGFDPRNLLTVKVLLPRSRYSTDQQRIGFFHELVDRVGRLPQVASASLINFPPFTGLGAATGFTIENRPAPAAGETPVVDSRVIEPGYFDTMKIPFISGRNFNEREALQESHVVIVNETMARLYFPGEDPIGKRITIQMKDNDSPSQIIGIVQDVKHASFDTPVRAMAYWPQPELSYSLMTLVVRTAGNPLAVVPDIRSTVLSMDSQQPISDVATMEQLLGESVARSRFSTLLLSIFSGVALLLAAVGIYGVMSYSVSQRFHEIGVRMALGAKRRDVLKLIVADGMVLSLIGVALGLGASFWLTRLLTTLLYSTSPTDPVTFIVIALVLIGVSLLASYVPARRATKVDPMNALRYE